MYHNENNLHLSFFLAFCRDLCEPPACPFLPSWKHHRNSLSRSQRPLKRKNLNPDISTCTSPVLSPLSCHATQGGERVQGQLSEHARRLDSFLANCYCACMLTCCQLSPPSVLELLFLFTRLYQILCQISRMF